MGLFLDLFQFSTDGSLLGFVPIRSHPLIEKVIPQWTISIREQVLNMIDTDLRLVVVKIIKRFLVKESFIEIVEFF
jgi:hypothetical protein